MLKNKYPEQKPPRPDIYKVSGQWPNEPREYWTCEYMDLGPIAGWSNPAAKPMIDSWEEIDYD